MLQVLETEARMYAGIHDVKREEFALVQKLHVELRNDYHKIMHKLSLSERDAWKGKLHTLTLQLNVLRNEEDATYWDWQRAERKVQNVYNRQLPEES